MARMRWMRNEATGQAVAVCLYCGAEEAGDPARNSYCYCRSGGGRASIPVHGVSPAGPSGAA